MHACERGTPIRHTPMRCTPLLGFGEVVLSRICWSSDPTIINMPYNGKIHRGVWAGHCFGITTRARHEQDVKEEWKDVSEEVAKEIASI
jgi:hypothetical protein